MAKDSFRGKVISGVGQGAFFAGLDWVKEQCRAALGFEPWPGTLNLDIREEDAPALERLLRSEGICIVPPDKNFCEGRCWKVRIGKIPAALVAPEEKARIHGKNIVEILAPVKLKDTLNIKDGDEVEIEVDSQAVEQ
ncbi:MAG: CTP-dependent riboflavin kinase [Chloroflexi bacterium]|nr:CTP-dependent riboflavin kinase [Chloroflexota bacterium]